MNRRGQLTIFLIVATIVLVGALIMIRFTSGSHSDALTTETQKHLSADTDLALAKFAIEDSIRQLALQGVQHIASHGGLYCPQQGICRPASVKVRDDIRVLFNSDHVPDFSFSNFYADSSPETFQGLLTQYVQDNIGRINIERSLNSLGYRVSSIGLAKVTVSIRGSSLFAKVDYPLSIEKGGVRTSISSFVVVVPHDVTHIFRMADPFPPESITKNDAWDLNAIPLSQEYPVTIDRRTGNSNFDIINITDPGLLIVGQPYYFSYVRENRKPEIDFKDNVKPRLDETKDTVLDIYCPSTAYYDYDEDSIRFSYQLAEPAQPGPVEFSCSPGTFIAESVVILNKESLTSKCAEEYEAGQANPSVRIDYKLVISLKETDPPNLQSESTVTGTKSINCEEQGIPRPVAPLAEKGNCPVEIQPPSTTYCTSSNNKFGMHTFFFSDEFEFKDEDDKNIIRAQLGLVKDMVGECGWLVDVVPNFGGIQQGKLDSATSAQKEQWEKTIFFLKEAQSRNLRVIIRAAGNVDDKVAETPFGKDTAVWKLPNPGPEGGYKSATEWDPESGDYTAIASQYAATISRLREQDINVNYLQIWNEPNLNLEWGDLPPNPEEFSRFYAKVAETINICDPQGTINLLGPAFAIPINTQDSNFQGRNMDNLIFIDQMFKSEYGDKLRDYIDSWSTHSYFPSYGTGNYYNKELEKLPFAPSVMITETGTDQVWPGSGDGSPGTVTTIYTSWLDNPKVKSINPYLLYTENTAFTDKIWVKLREGGDPAKKGDYELSEAYKTVQLLRKGKGIPD